MKQERERFFNSEFHILLTGASNHLLLGGDFSCILETSNPTGGFNYSRALAELMHSLALRDIWPSNPARKDYSHYSVSGATRIDRIYATHDLVAMKMGVEFIVTPFTDHFAVCLRISTVMPIMRPGRGYGKWTAPS
jgi:endonuclease/exonuclease/phosphatase family metal-dependent hydrolase